MKNVLQKLVRSKTEMYYSLLIKTINYVDNEGSTIRGCESTIDCTLDNNCQLCSDNLCNSNMYPEDRKICIHCHGDNCANPIELTNMTKICNTYEVKQKCYTAVEGKQY